MKDEERTINISVSYTDEYGHNYYISENILESMYHDPAALSTKLMQMGEALRLLIE